MEAYLSEDQEGTRSNAARSAIEERRKGGVGAGDRRRHWRHQSRPCHFPGIRGFVGLPPAPGAFLFPCVWLLNQILKDSTGLRMWPHLATQFRNREKTRRLSACCEPKLFCYLTSLSSVRRVETSFLSHFLSLSGVWAALILFSANFVHFERKLNWYNMCAKSPSAFRPQPAPSSLSWVGSSNQIVGDRIWPLVATHFCTTQ